MTYSLDALIIEDDADVALACEQTLQLEGWQVRSVPRAEEALAFLTTPFSGIVISDIRLPGMDGMALLEAAKRQDPELPVILITGHGDIHLAVQAMKDGAYDFLTKPFAPERLQEAVRRALQQRRSTLAVRELSQQIASRDRMDARLLGDSLAMQRLRQTVAALARSQADVLVLGETGTGKELVARCLHELSPRHEAPFIALNCGALSESLLDSELFGHEAGAFTGASKRRVGRIEAAHGGTLFLDEIESMPPAMQVRLLRVLQERQLERVGSHVGIAVDLRVVAATKTDLLALAQAGSFRHDLYYRLAVAPLPLPALRERGEDVLLLLDRFLLEASARHGLPCPPLGPLHHQRLLAHGWPGNVRELRNVADRLVLGIAEQAEPFLGMDAAPQETTGGAKASEHPGLQDGMGSPAPSAVGAGHSPATASLQAALDQLERQMVAEALRQHGSLARAAEALGIGKTTLHDKVKKHGLQGSDGA